MVVAHHLSATGFDFDDHSLYRSLVGALQYLTITCSDITHVVTAVSQYMHKPYVSHFQAIKRILRYVKGTLQFGIFFAPSSSREILAYYVFCSIFLAVNLVSHNHSKHIDSDYHFVRELVAS